MLVNAPLVDQLADAMPGDPNDENARANCVPASLASGLMALLPGTTVYADQLKDAVYGEGYTGATDPAHFVAHLASTYHIALRATQSADGGALVSAVLTSLRAGQPATGAIPSQWGSTTAAQIAASGGPTHEVLFCDAADGATLTAMNPWPVDGAHAFYQTMPASWWASRLCYERIFEMTLETGAPVWVPVNDGSGFYQDSLGHICGGTAGAYIFSHGLQATNGLDKELYPDIPGASAFVALDNGVAVMSHKQPDGTWLADENAAQTLLALYHAASAPAPAPNVTSAQQALAIAAQAVSKAETLLGGH